MGDYFDRISYANVHDKRRAHGSNALVPLIPPYRGHNLPPSIYQSVLVTYMFAR